MKNCLRFLVLETVLLFGLYDLDSSFATSMLQDEGVVQINWSSARFRSFGIAEVKDKTTQGIVSAESLAFNNAYDNFSSSLNQLVTTVKKNTKQVDFKAFKPSIYLAKTEYYDLSSVKVIAEARIARLFSNEGLRFLDPSVVFEQSKNTGVIFNLKSSYAPEAVYTIYDEKSQILFDSSKVYASAFDTSLMGKWFKGTSGSYSDIEKVVGNNPARIDVEVVDGKLQVNSSKWQELISGNEQALAQAKVVLVQ